jgi:hypothetical protein
VLATVVDRERGRVRLRAVTLTTGMAGLITAGVIAYNLPAPAHSQTASSKKTGGTAATRTSSTGSAGRTSSSGDDGEQTSTATPKTATGSSGGGTTSHATSGGS